jgi:hypothetical protein
MQVYQGHALQSTARTSPTQKRSGLLRRAFPHCLAACFISSVKGSFFKTALQGRPILLQYLETVRLDMSAVVPHSSRIIRAATSLLGFFFSSLSITALNFPTARGVRGDCLGCTVNNLSIILFHICVLQLIQNNLPVLLRPFACDHHLPYVSCASTFCNEARCTQPSCLGLEEPLVRVL